jgi:hypothetical protein
MIQMPLRETFATARPNGVPIMLSLMVTELADVLPAKQIGNFAFSLGQRLAARIQMAEVTDLNDLQQCLNRLWSDMGLGQARLSVDELAIAVEHDPGTLRPDVLDPAARPAFMEFLRGTYHACFHLLGSADAMVTSAAWTGQVIEIRHGN